MTMRHPPDRRRHARLAFLMMLSIAGLAFLSGFVAFVASIEQAEPNLTLKVEGVVALTGGAERISDALDLLAEGHADRLLITGVNQSTRRAEIARLMPRYRFLFTCCVDLGYQALNTVGNATETRRWVRARAIRSLIVVTSNYHMPRALVEIGNALPGVEIVPYPVVTDRQRSVPLWADASLLRLLALEYVKYLAAVARTHLTGTPVEDEMASRAMRGT